MKIDLYHLHRGFHATSVVYPIMLDVLRVWADSAGWETRVSVCKESRVDLSTDADVVGFSVYTPTAPGIYRASDELRKRGKIVVFGGPHFRGPSTFAEAAPHCDVIVRSIFEEQWQELLGAVAAGKIRPNQPHPVCIADQDNQFRYPNNFYQGLDNRRWYQIPTIPTSIGCPYSCDFCSAFMGGKYILREIETIVNEMAHTRSTTVVISDATFGLNKKFTIDLMRAIAPLKKKIALETTLGRLKDPEILDALALGGVKWFEVGIESLAHRLRKHGSSDPGARVKELVDRAHDRGMLVQANFICGLDSDGPESFEQIYQCYDRSGLDAIMFGILIPYPDTPLYLQLQSEGRIFDTNWEHYDYHHVVYRPRRMTVDQLIDGYIELYRNVRSRKSIFREVSEGLKKNGMRAESVLMITHNLYQKFDSIKKQRLLMENKREIAERNLPEWEPEPAEAFLAD